jgi:superfamily II DNA or RNA helicase
MSGLPLLWAHQQKIIDEARARIRGGFLRLLVQLATGGGKTRLAIWIACSFLGRAGARRVLWIAPSRELAFQAHRALVEAGIEAGLIVAGEVNPAPAAAVQVALIHTLLAWELRPVADLVVVDEAHRILAGEWRKVIDFYSRTIVIGLTATPERSDGVPMGDVFETLIVGPPIRDLVAAGHLVPCDVLAPTTHLEDGVLGDAVGHYRKHGEGRQAFAFGLNVEHARALAEEFNVAGIPAACIDGDMPDEERDGAIERFRRGALHVLTNVRCLTEGVDVPEASVCILASGCSSPSSYLQKIGRVRRAAPGKSRALVLDLKGSVHVHGLPDDDRIYSLQGRAIRDVEKLPVLVQCRRCGACYRARPTCIRCGARLPPPKLPRELRGELSEIFATAGIDEKRRYLERMHAEARARGHKPGWAAFKFKAKYGHWPQRSAA